MNNPKVRKDYRFPGMDRNKPLVLDENYCVTTSEATGSGIPMIDVEDNFKSYDNTEITDEATIASLETAGKSHILFEIVPTDFSGHTGYITLIPDYIIDYGDGYEIYVTLPSAIGGTLNFYKDTDEKWYATYQGGSSS